MKRSDFLKALAGLPFLGTLIKCEADPTGPEEDESFVWEGDPIVVDRTETMQGWPGDMVWVKIHTIESGGSGPVNLTVHYTVRAAAEGV